MQPLPAAFTRGPKSSEGALLEANHPWEGWPVRSSVLQGEEPQAMLLKEAMNQAMAGRGSDDSLDDLPETLRGGIL